MAITTNELAFAQPFESHPVITEAEALDAALQFRYGIDDLFLRNVAAVIHATIPYKHPHYDSDNLKMRYQPSLQPPQESSQYDNTLDGHNISLWVDLSTLVDSDGIPAPESSIVVMLTEENSIGDDVRSLGYLLNPDAKQVVRHEATDAYSLWHGGWQRTIGQTALATNSLETAEELTNQHAHLQLESKVHLNNLPVGGNEITSLLALLNKSQAFPPYNPDKQH